MKILVIYATAGAGHRRAAEAVTQVLREETRHNTILVDALTHASWLYKYSYSATYTFMITKCPWLWAFFFGLLDIPCLQKTIWALRRLQNTVHGRGLARYLIEEDFDYIISTHFFPNEVASALKQSGRIRARIISCVTDFDVHRFWLGPGINYYACASSWTADKLFKLGVVPERIKTTGIPTDKCFSQHPDAGEVRRRLGISEKMFTVLIATGSFGIGPMEELIDRLPGFQILVVCGHNAGLYERLRQRDQKDLKVYGLVKNMDELMAAADVMITKPGGLSIAEALVTGLPLIFFSAIPGQEKHNVEVLKTYGVGISGCSLDEMAGELKKFQDSPEACAQARAASRALGRPDAARQVVNLIPQQ